ncbi:beta-galactosidase [Devosia epidermidihirudinis]|uniref:Beta-galactosidase n=1 Tax=Devosia epidermidihirudinis TaxID=1293439 RepID=A0A0F5QF04_9HYPH|nr:beta-galactosidase [Devosia epidermidihirudinis]KKC39326.1 beta-galactosidase [Devosia epidermidihirudinis]
MITPALGVCYYPEHWPEAWWESDAARMAEVGIKYVRIGEFAWSKLEPTPGDLQFDWIIRSMDVLGRHGLKVVFGTPTATPPRWMIDKHPDMLAVDVNGKRRGFGSRRHYDFSHLGYREECARITQLLADAVGDHPALGGWQTDNEYGCHDTTYSYSPAAQAGFQHWLSEKYGTIDALNHAWGNVFWSMEYNRFDQVELPNLLVTEAAPAQALDFRRYSSDQVAAFNKMQYDILKAKRPDLPVIHNFMGRYTDFDHYDVAETLDVASWDSYPIGFLAISDEPDEVKRQYMRQGEPDLQAFHHDLYRAVGHGRIWIMEQQPGPVNWAQYNPDPLPGMARLWAWEAFAHGAEVVSYFRWRQAPFAQEQMHAGLLRPDSEPAPAYHEAMQVAEELKSTGIAGNASKGRVALVYDYESEWAWQIQPQAKGYTHGAHVRALYAAFRKHGVDIDILPPSAKSFVGYDIVAITSLFTWNDDLRTAITEFDGHVLIGPRSGSKDENFAIPAALAPSLPSNLLDVKVMRVDSSDPNVEVEVRGGGGAVRHWRERIETKAKVIIEDVEGWPVLVSQGKLYYQAASGNKALTQRVADYLIAEVDLPTVNLPAGVRCRTRDGFRIYVNYGAGNATLTPAADEVGYALGGVDMPAAGVTVARLAKGA